MPSGITRARVTSCCSLVIRISAASRSLFNAGSDWVGSCAITIKRRRDPTPKVQSWNSGSARRDWEIEQVEDAALLPVTPTLRSGKLNRPVKYRFPTFEYFGHTGYRRRRLPYVSPPCALLVLWAYHSRGFSNSFSCLSASASSSNELSRNRAIPFATTDFFYAFPSA